MNYIHQLQSQIVDLNDQHLRRADRFQEFREHLASPKFGPQADGSRGDWISVADVQRWLQYIEDIGQNHV
jgi:hypothetical protein